ncbi:MAG: hypothetical protein LUF33_02570, partial [Clostridiales bacterium]|nr:hypothetical protein [Clostridiales bacterium]
MQLFFLSTAVTAFASGYIELDTSVYEVTQLPDNLEEPDEDTAAQLKAAYIALEYTYGGTSETL